MRKFKFTGNPKDYTSPSIKPPIVGRIYNGNSHRFSGINYTIEELHDYSPEDWQEVFESQKLIKDTDLGYFSGLVASALVSTGSSVDAEWCIIQAKELIRQLKEESINHP